MSTTVRPDTSKLINNAASLRRLTVGDYRVIYGIAEAQKTVIIELIRHKSMVLMALAALALEVRVKNFSP
jgi:mRNA-degrading endonuclease RelE of RelBE toxin-antitoxin system